MFRWLLAGLAMFVGFRRVEANDAQAKRPNILILIADDWSYPHAGIYGDKVVKTPNIDKLARRGMRFHRAFTAAPSCTPSRGAILTGQAIHRLKAGGNLWSALPREYRCLPDWLGDAGYILGLFGKGWGPGSLEGTDRKYNPAGPNVKNFREFLQGIKPEQPFYFWYGSKHPHRPYTQGTGQLAKLKPAEVTVPPVWPDTPEVRSDVLDYYLQVQQFDAEVGDILQALAESGRLENTIVLILSDNGMPFPRAKANLYDLGCRMPLLVAWPGRIPQNQESHAFISFTDLAPTILEAAGIAQPQEMTGKSFLNVLKGEAKGQDRTQVFLERERHANVRKGDLSYPCRALRTDQHLYIWNVRPERWPAGDPELYFAVGPFGDIDDGPTKQLILKGKDGTVEQKKLFDLSCGKRAEEELYDCLADPHQMVNLANDPRHAKKRLELREILLTWMMDTGDPRAAANGGDDRWDQFQYFGGPATKGGPKKGKIIIPKKIGLP